MKNENIKLKRKIYKNLSKSSDIYHYNKNLSFIKKLINIYQQGNLLDVILIERNIVGIPNKWEHPIIDKYYHSLLKIDNDFIPVPIVIDTLFGVNYINDWDSKQGIKRLVKIYTEMKSLFTFQSQYNY